VVDSRAVPAKLAMYEGEGELNLSAIRGKLGGLGKVLESRGVLFALRHGVAQSKVGGMQLRVECKSALKGALRRFQQCCRVRLLAMRFAHRILPDGQAEKASQQDVAQIRPGQRRAWIGGDRGLRHAQCGFKLAALARNQAQAQQRRRMCGGGEEHAAVLFGGFAQIAAAMRSARCGELILKERPKRLRRLMAIC
jgi:hypothetical protein